MNEFLTSGVCFKTRRIFLQGNIEEEVVGKVIRGLYAMAALKKEEPITLFVSSYGGSLDDAMGLVDVMRTLGCPVATVAIGKCMSAAPLIVAAGEPGHRYSMVNTSWMLHDVEQDVGVGCPDWIEGMAIAGKVISKRFAEMLGEWTERKKHVWVRIFKMKKDRFFTAEQAWEWGIVDSVITDIPEEEEEE
jgi:ATP-dependent Clp protease protease subunit